MNARKAQLGQKMSFVDREVEFSIWCWRGRPFWRSLLCRACCPPEEFVVAIFIKNVDLDCSAVRVASREFYPTDLEEVFSEFVKQELAAVERRSQHTLHRLPTHHWLESWPA